MFRLQNVVFKNSELNDYIRHMRTYGGEQTTVMRQRSRQYYSERIAVTYAMNFIAYVLLLDDNHIDRYGS